METLLVGVKQWIGNEVETGSKWHMLLWLEERCSKGDEEVIS